MPIRPVFLRETRRLGRRTAHYGLAWHTAVGPQIGGLRDNEPAALIHPDAFGDDLASLDDEDGLQSITLVAASTTAGAVVLAMNPTGTDATLAGWVDFDLSGTLDPGERTSAIVPATTVAPTPFNLNWVGLAPIPVGFSSFARFRIAIDPAEVATAIGGATSGEVEDHRVPIITPPIELVITKVSNAASSAPLIATELPVPSRVGDAKATGSWSGERGGWSTW